jgi:ribosomal protein L37AE/L43A
MTNDPRIPKCPKCRSNDYVHEEGARNWICLPCDWTFDDDPDEGGTHSDNPVRSAERSEEHEARQAANRRGRVFNPHAHRRRRKGR